jgi:hypothetical protein
MTQTAQLKGSNARDRLLALAEAAVLEKGFAATSIDELIAGGASPKAGSSTTSRTRASSPRR